MDNAENTQEVEQEQQFLKLYACQSRPTMNLQHSEGKGDERVEHDFKFVNGVLRFDDPKQHEIFRKALAAVHPSIANTIIEVGDRSKAEEIALAHRRAKLRESQAINGPLTSDAMHRENPELLDLKVQTEQAARGAPGKDLKNLFATLGGKNDAKQQTGEPPAAK